MNKIVIAIIVAALFLQTGFLSGAPGHAQRKITATPTAALEPTNPPTLTPGPSPTGSGEPQPSQTPLSSETPVPSETPTPAETLLPSETPSPSATPTASETPTPTLGTSLPSQTAAGIVLSLWIEPPFVTPSGTVNLFWQIGGVERVEQGAFLRFYVPPGLSILEKEAKVNQARGTADLPIRAVKGMAKWQADAAISLPARLEAEFWQGGQAQAKAGVDLPALEAGIGAAGGEAVGLNGKVRVIFPPGALTEKVQVKIDRPSKEALPVQSLSGAPFEITAVSEETKAEVKRFEKPVEIQVQYSEAGMSEEANTRLFWYDPADGEWKPPLSQSIDTENNIITALTDHFTVFDTYNSNWQAAITPTLEYFQHAGFTGAASFSIPITVPAGPGGFQPSLTLSYSSSVIDSASSTTQASWVGMGWSLATSYIELYANGTTGWVDDDAYQLNLNGMSVTLYKGADDRWHASEENFYRVEFNIPNYQQDQSAWTIWDKSGNRYFFETRVFSNAQSNTVWRWYLTRAQNAHGREIAYTYYAEKQTKKYYDDQCQCWKNIQVTNWVYPLAITYGHGRYRIVFTRIGPDDAGHRLDYKTEWTYPFLDFYAVFQRSLLSSIQAQQDANGDGTFETIVREYKFAYCQSASCSILSNLVWSAGGRTPTLLSVQEYGVGGAAGGQALPPYTFTYGDGMHLTGVSNGYGGSVTFAYESAPWYGDMPIQTGPGAPWHHGIHDYETPNWGNPFQYTFNGSDQNWMPTDRLTSYVTYAGNSITIKGIVEQRTYPTLQSFQPGRWYVIVASARVGMGASASLQLGIGSAGGLEIVGGWDSQPAHTLTSAYRTIVSAPIYLPKNATALYPKMKSTGFSQVDWYYLFPLPTVYRVTARTLTAGGQSYNFTYSYQGAALNSPEISEAAAGAWPYIPPYSEFRGHSRVIEIDPYGKRTVTRYYQDDCRTGKSQTVTIREADSQPLQQQTYAYACDTWNSTLVMYDRNRPLYRDENGRWVYQRYDTLKYHWPRLTGETKTVFDASGAEAASLTTEYEYEPTYGNQIAKTVSGTGIETTITHTDYFPNPNGDRWLVGLPARTWVTDGGGNLLAETLNLYDGANSYNRQPASGILTATRKWVSGNLYSQTSMEYDDWGNVISQTVWTGYGTASSAPTSGAQTTTTVYDPIYHTYAVQTINPLGHVTNVTYNYTLGLPISETDPNGAVTTATYDAFGRFTSLTRPGDSSPTLTVSYQNSPFVVTLQQRIDDSHTYTVTRHYDGMGRQTLVNTNGILTASTFDAYGNPLTQSTPHTSGETAYFTTTTYDALGRPLTVTAPDGTVTTTAYNGLTTSVTDANGHTHTTVTDILGRTLSVAPPTGPAVTFTYDPLGNMLTATRGGATVTLTYDNAGRKLTMDDPDMGFWQYSYDALGNMKTQLDARGCTLTIGYDALNRPVSKSSSGAGCGTQVNTSYTYDAGTNGIGRRTSMADGSGSTSWLYDARGRVTKETKVISSSTFVTEWTYNSADLPVTMKYPDGEIVTTTYDSRMLPTSVIGTDTYVSSMTYDSASRLLTRALGNGLTQYYTYYPWNQQGGRLQTLVTGSLQNLTYQYDPVGNILTIADSVNTIDQTFGYDALDRLTSASATGAPGQGAYNEAYEYDPATGNLYIKGGVTLEYLDSSHVHAVTNANGSTFVYDANGNQITRNIGPDIFNLLYDAENRLVEVKKNNVTIAHFTYDGDGARVKSVINGETMLFVGNYFEQKGVQFTKYYFAGAARIAMRKYTIPQNMTVEYMLGDHLGSTSITTDSNGAKVSEMRYKPWGEVRYTWTDAPANTSPAYELVKYQFTGQYSYDVEFGLLFFNARWLDPVTGRFAQADIVIPFPGNSQSWDRYAYALNNSLKYVDPSGHIPKDEICRYMGICGENAEEIFRNTYGDELWKLLWDTEISWGSVLMWDNGSQMAMLVLMDSGDEGYYGGLFGIQGEQQGEFFELNELTGIDKIYAIADPEVEGIEDLPRYHSSNEACTGGSQYGFYNYIDVSEGWWTMLGLGFFNLPARIALVLTTAGGVIDIAGASPLPASTQYYLNHSVGLPWSSYPVVYMNGNLLNHVNPPSGQYRVSLWRPQPAVFPSWNSR